MSLVVIYAWILFVIMLVAGVWCGLLWDDDQVAKYFAKKKEESVGTWRVRTVTQAILALPLIGRVLGWW